jgi:hypothetical protein
VMLPPVTITSVEILSASHQAGNALLGEAKEQVANWKVKNAQPVVTSAVNTNAGQETFQFSSVEGATGYQIEISTDARFSNVTTYDSNSPTLTVNNLKRGKYFVRVRAYRTTSSGETVYSTTSAVLSFAIKR